MRFIIVDNYSKDPGYVYDSPIEGWIFTKLKNDATQFNSRAEATEVIQKHYKRLAQYLKVQLFQVSKDKE